MGPGASSVGESGNIPFSDMRPKLGLTPTTPLKAAGMRQEPAVSEPSVAGTIPSATATALHETTVIAITARQIQDAVDEASPLARVLVGVLILLGAFGKPKARGDVT